MNAEFEKYAQDQLDQFEVPVDTEALWAEIEPVIRPKKDNLRFIWFFLFGLLIGGIGIAGLYTGMQNNPDEALNTHEFTTATIDQTPVVQKNKVSLNDPLPAANTTTILSNKLKEEATPAAVTQANLYKARPKPILNTVAKTSESTPSIINISKSADFKSQTFSDQDLSLIASQEDVSDSDNNSSNHLSNRLDDVSTNDGYGKQKETSLNPWAKALVPLSLFNGPISADDRFAAEMDVLESIKADLEKDDLAELLNSQAADKQIKKRRSSFLRDLQFGIGAYGGISRSTTALAPRSAADQTYELLRINSEKQLETLHAGLSALIVSDEKLYLRTGVEYTRIGSLFSQSSSRVEIDSVPGVVEIQINEITGDTTEIIGNLLRTRTTRYIKKSYNYFHLVDVPIIFGYNFGSEKVTIGIEAGIYANILLQNKGEVFQPDESFYDKGEDPDGWYKSNIGISPFIGCNIAYHLNENLQLHLSPGFRFQSVYSTSANPLKEQHANLGVTAGVRYIFDNY